MYYQVISVSVFVQVFNTPSHIECVTGVFVPWLTSTHSWDLIYHLIYHHDRIMWLRIQVSVYLLISRGPCRSHCLIFIQSGLTEEAKEQSWSFSEKSLRSWKNTVYLFMRRPVKMGNVRLRFQDLQLDNRQVNRLLLLYFILFLVW